MYVAHDNAGIVQEHVDRSVNLLNKIDLLLTGNYASLHSYSFKINFRRVTVSRGK